MQHLPPRSRFSRRGAGLVRDRRAATDASFTLRKQVNPETICLECHGQLPPYEVMGLTGHWRETNDLFRNDCLPCHATTRTNRHNVNYLDAKAIEVAALAGKDDQTAGDGCFGCHGGRAWYRIACPHHVIRGRRCRRHARMGKIPAHAFRVTFPEGRTEIMNNSQVLILNPARAAS